MNGNFDIENVTLVYYAGKGQTSVTLPDGVTQIQDFAFAQFSSLRTGNCPTAFCR